MYLVTTYDLFYCAQLNETLSTSVIVCSIILFSFCAGVLYRDAGDIALAINAYEQCLKIDPDSRNAGQV